MFYGPSTNFWSFQARSINLVTVPGQASWAVYQYLVPSLLPVTDNCPSWISGRVENGCRIFFFMTKSQPHRCYLVLSIVLIIIILVSPFNISTSNDGKGTTLFYSPEWSYWPYSRFYSYRFSQVHNKHTFFNKESWGCFQSLVKTNHAAPILQLNLVTLATLREYSNSFLYWNARYG